MEMDVFCFRTERNYPPRFREVHPQHIAACSQRLLSRGSFGQGSGRRTECGWLRAVGCRARFPGKVCKNSRPPCLFIHILVFAFILGSGHFRHSWRLQVYRATPPDVQDDST